jgi:predicted nucleotidyltransferase
MLTLDATSLSRDERALLQRFADRLIDHWGDRLYAVWLFGSRARGEAPAHEDSDVDLLVLVDDPDWRRKDRVYDDLYEAARELDLEDLAFDFAVHVDTPEWLAGRREIKSFFIAEVDRDKVVVVGHA